MAVGVGADQTSTSLTLTSSWQTIQSGGTDLEITLDANELLELQVDTDFEATPADNAQWRVISSSFSDSAVVGTKVIAGPYEQDNADDPSANPGPITIFGHHKVKVQVKQTGASDTTNSATARYKIHTLS